MEEALGWNFFFEAHEKRKASETSRVFFINVRKVRPLGVLLFYSFCINMIASCAVQMKMQHAGRKPPEMEGGAGTVGDLKFHSA